MDYIMERTGFMGRPMEWPSIVDLAEFLYLPDSLSG
jgi:hypothetical protein